MWTAAIETYFDATAVMDVERHVAKLRGAHNAMVAGSIPACSTK